MSGREAEMLVAGGVVACAEGANMPCDPEAIQTLTSHGVLFAPAKASNAGGVGTSGLEMSQNSQRLHWSREEVDMELEKIMVKIHGDSVKIATEYDRPGDYVFGANAHGFVKVADAMLAQGLV